MLSFIAVICVKYIVNATQFPRGLVSMQAFNLRQGDGVQVPPALSQASGLNPRYVGPGF